MNARLICLTSWLYACGASAPVVTPDDTDPTPVDTVGARPDMGWTQPVRVLLDGQPVADALVMQGGGARHARTDADGRAEVEVDPSVLGDLVVIAAHPEARVRGVDVDRGPVDLVTVELARFPTTDNADYVFQDPGTPERREDTSYCSHCHVRQVEDWVVSAHEAAARNPIVHDVYSGTAVAADATACAQKGGAWVTGRRPGGGQVGRCRLGAGALPDLNPGCGVGALCETPEATGGCADCHAPGIDGALGGRDLLDATGISHDHGVHCDVCHKVSDVDLDAPPGVGGRLKIVRPIEPSTVATLTWEPITFAPLPDVVNPRMGSVWTPLFREAELCAGCHQHDQPVLLPGQAIDTVRWPGGRLPVQSTYAEWLAGPLAQEAPCQSCHMPPDPIAGNSADVDLQPEATVGRAAGWWRPAGSTRRHTWNGPRTPGPDFLRLSAALDVATEVVDGQARVDVTLRHTGPGHALPTGEPMRSLVLTVSARCDGQPLQAVGGDAVPSFGGHRAVRRSGEDWSVWPEARPGDVVRVVREEGLVDYPGFGPFGDGTFDAAAKGLPRSVVVGAVTVVAVDAEGVVTFDAPLPKGTVAWLGDAGSNEDGTAARALAGAPGFAFARVLVDPEGQEQAPHHRAVDVRVDNRLLPGTSWTSAHVFDSPCADPEVTARVTWRAYPTWLATERGWDNPDRLVVEATR